MSESTWDRAKRIFHEVLERPPEERPGCLEQSCAGEPELRAEVERLLASHAELGGTAAPTLPDERERPAAREGTSLGPYKLLQEIGEGGFGTVYMAEQQQPVRRKVALKVIKLGMDTKQVIARFEAERQALALMDHPNIARVLDAGATQNGRPYFVMELVRGIPITEYCDSNKLTTRERLELFMDVCSAVQHAHQKGIIHRDLKPSNVMVTLHDGRPVPKIIDFGIAKAMNQRLTEKTLFTAYEQFVGTPQYMSPEQAEMSGLDVDTRTDIYALGVLLYELMTGTTPFDARRLREAGLEQIHRIIREEDPPRPSTRLSTLGEAATTTAGHHRTDVAGLQRELRGDLDWIVMKALEKDRTRRFETASSLRMDIERHLAAEPVLARPPSVGYRLQTFLRRHRLGVAVASFVVLALVAGTALALTGLVQARRERAVAQAEADAAAAINSFFSEMLVSVDPQQSSRHSAVAPLGQVAAASATSLDREISVADMLVRSRAGISQSFAGKPRLEAVARETIGMGLFGFGLYEPATEELRAAWELRKEGLGAGHPETLRSEVQLGLVLADGNRADEALALLEQAARTSAELLGPEDPRTLAARSVLAHALVNARRHGEAGPILEDVLELQRRILGDGHPDTIQTLLWWGESLQWRNRGEEAGRLTGEALESARRHLPPGDALTMQALSFHGWSLAFQGRYGEAEELLREAVAGFTRLFGSEHSWTALAKIGLGRSLRAPDQQEEKERLWREAVSALRATQGEASPTLFVIRRDLAALLIRRDQAEEGLRRLRATVEAFAEHYGESHSWARDLHGNLVSALFSEGRIDEGLRELEGWRARWAEAGPERLTSRASLELRIAGALERFGRPEEALRAGRAAIELRERIAEHRGTPRAFATAAWTWLTCDPAELRDAQRGVALATRALELLDDEQEDRRPGILDALGRAQYDAGLIEAARATQRQVLRHPASRESRSRPAQVARLALYLSGPGGLEERRALIDDEVAALRRADEPAWPRLRRLGLELGGRGVPAERVLDAALEECGRDEQCTEAERADLWNLRGTLLSWQGREGEALAAHDRAIRELEGVEASPLLTVTRLNRAVALLATGATDEARAVAAAALAACDESGESCLNEQRTLGAVLLRAGELEEAERLLAAVARGERSGAWNGEAHRIASAQSLWGEALSRLGRHAEAEPLLLASHETLRRERLQGTVTALLDRSEARIVALYESWGRPEALEAWRRSHGRAQPRSSRGG